MQFFHFLYKKSIAHSQGVVVLKKIIEKLKKGVGKKIEIEIEIIYIQRQKISIKGKLISANETIFIQSEKSGTFIDLEAEKNKINEIKVAGETIYKETV